MPATVTLSTTTLVNPANRGESQIKVASTSGLTSGVRLFVDKELMSVVSLGVSPWVNVRRGVDGTAAQDHDSSATVYVGDASSFYSFDPQGAPPEAILVSPWINVRTGDVWFAQGDVMPTGATYRWWQKQTVTPSIGALGKRVFVLDPTSST